MYSRKVGFIVLIVIFLYSCKSGFKHDSAGMTQLSSELKAEFGEDAWYTSIELVNNGGSDDLVTVDVTRDPNSLRQEQWTLFHGFWDKKANVTLTIQGAEPRSFMFQLDHEVRLSLLGTLMERSRKVLEEEKGIQDPQVLTAQIKSSNQMNSKQEGIYYSISLRGKKEEKSFNFVYDLNGTLKSRTE